MVEPHEIGAGSQLIAVDRLPIVAQIQMRIGRRRKTEIGSVEAPDADLAPRLVAAISRVSGEPALALKCETHTCVEIHQLVSASLVTSNA